MLMILHFVLCPSWNIYNDSVANDVQVLMACSQPSSVPSPSLGLRQPSLSSAAVALRPCWIQLENFPAVVRAMFDLTL